MLFGLELHRWNLAKLVMAAPRHSNYFCLMLLLPFFFPVKILGIFFWWKHRKWVKKEKQNERNEKESTESRILVRLEVSQATETGWELERVPGTGCLQRAGTWTSLLGRIEHRGKKEENFLYKETEIRILWWKHRRQGTGVKREKCAFKKHFQS